MAERRKPTDVRLIPNFAMDKPWTEPVSAEEEEAMASLAVLAGVPDNARAIADYFRQLDNAQYAALVEAAANQGIDLPR